MLTSMVMITVPSILICGLSQLKRPHYLMFVHILSAGFLNGRTGNSTQDMLTFAQISTCVFLLRPQQLRLISAVIDARQDLSVCRPSTSQWLRLHRGIMNLCGPDASRGDCKTML